MHDAFINHIRGALRRQGAPTNAGDVHELIAAVHQPDVAFILDELTVPEAVCVFTALDEDRAAQALSQVAPATKRHLIQASPTTRILRLLQRLPMDDVAEVVSAAGEDGKRLLALLPASQEVERLLRYPKQTAGRLMTTKFAAVLPSVTVGRALEYLRAVAPTVETITTVYVVDADHIIGVCSIRDLLIARSDQPVHAIMKLDVVTVSPDTDQQDVVRLIGHHDLLAVPVVDADGCLLGIVTVDDALDVLSEEFNEDYAGLVGADASEMDRRAPAHVAWLRLPWLLGTMAIELCAGLIISRFDQTLRDVILLASFMPVISAVSGNVGLQATAIVVRGLDTGQVSLENWSQAVRRELATALTIALVVGVFLAIIAVAWARHIPFGLVVGAAMMCAILTAGFMGTAIPMLLKRFGFEPATTAGPLETAFQDVISFTVFLGMATLLTRWLV